MVLVRGGGGDDMPFWDEHFPVDLHTDKHSLSGFLYLLIQNNNSSPGEGTGQWKGDVTLIGTFEITTEMLRNLPDNHTKENPTAGGAYHRRRRQLQLPVTLTDKVKADHSSIIGANLKIQVELLEKPKATQADDLDSDEENYEEWSVSLQEGLDGLADRQEKFDSFVGLAFYLCFFFLYITLVTIQLNTKIAFITEEGLRTQINSLQTGQELAADGNVMEDIDLAGITSAEQFWAWITRAVVPAIYTGASEVIHTLIP
jgi:hypothetical protein